MADGVSRVVDFEIKVSDALVMVMEFDVIGVCEDCDGVSEGEKIS